MIAYLKAWWFLLGPRLRALLASLSVPALLLGVAFLPEFLAVIGSCVWVAVVACGMGAALWEHRRDRRRNLRSWRTVPHPLPCPHCRSGECLFPPARYGLEQAPDAHLWDETGHRITSPDGVSERPALDTAGEEVWLPLAADPGCEFCGLLVGHAHPDCPGAESDFVDSDALPAWSEN